MPGIVPHRHCIVCGKAIEPEERFCSKECKEQFDRDQKRQRNFLIAMFAILILMTFFMMLSTR